MLWINARPNMRPAVPGFVSRSDFRLAAFAFAHDTAFALATDRGTLLMGAYYVQAGETGIEETEEPADLYAVRRWLGY